MRRKTALIWGIVWFVSLFSVQLYLNPESMGYLRKALPRITWATKVDISDINNDPITFETPGPLSQNKPEPSPTQLPTPSARPSEIQNPITPEPPLDQKLEDHDDVLGEIKDQPSETETPTPPPLPSIIPPKPPGYISKYAITFHYTTSGSKFCAVLRLVESLNVRNGDNITVYMNVPKSLRIESNVQKKIDKLKIQVRRSEYPFYNRANFFNKYMKQMYQFRPLDALYQDDFNTDDFLRHEYVIFLWKPEDLVCLGELDGIIPENGSHLVSAKVAEKRPPMTDPTVNSMYRELNLKYTMNDRMMRNEFGQNMFGYDTRVVVMKTEIVPLILEKWMALITRFLPKYDLVDVSQICFTFALDSLDIKPHSMDATRNLNLALLLNAKRKELITELLGCFSTPLSFVMFEKENSPQGVFVPQRFGDSRISKGCPAHNAIANYTSTTDKNLCK